MELGLVAEPEAARERATKSWDLRGIVQQNGKARMTNQFEEQAPLC